MTEEQRRKLAQAVEKLLRREWGEEFRDDDAVNILNFCMDEVEDPRPKTPLPWPWPTK